MQVLELDQVDDVGDVGVEVDSGLARWERSPSPVSVTG